MGRVEPSTSASEQQNESISIQPWEDSPTLDSEKQPSSPASPWAQESGGGAGPSEGGMKGLYAQRSFLGWHLLGRELGTLVGPQLVGFGS